MRVSDRSRTRRWTRARVGVTCTALLGAALLTAPTRTAASGVQQGIDVSEFQGSINWTTVASHGISFAYIRAGEGTLSSGNFYKDKNFQTNWNGAAAAGITPGAYWFFHPGNDPTGQANTFTQQLQSISFFNGDVLPAIDVETTDGQPASTVISNLHTLVNAVQSSIGKLPAIYAAPSWWDSNVGSSDFTADPLWVAHWCGSCTGPAVPASNWGGNGWQAWQYSDAGNGSAMGVSSQSVDLDQGNPGPPLYNIAPPPPFKTTGSAQLTVWEGPGGHIYEAWCCAATPYSGWHNPIDLTGMWGGSAPTISSPSVTVGPDGTESVYWEGSGGHLYASQCCAAGTASGWQPPADLTAGWGGAAPLTSSPAATLSGTGARYLYWEGSGGHLYTAANQGSGWQAPLDLTSLWSGAAPPASAPAAAVRPDGTQLVYWQGPSGHLYTASCCTGSHPSGWAAPVDVTGALGGAAPLVSPPSAVLTADGSQQLYWEGPGNHLFTTTSTRPIQCGAPSPGSRGCLVVGNLAGWLPPVDVTNLMGASPMSSAPAATLKADGTQLVYWEDPSGHLDQTVCCDSPGNGGWRNPLDMTSMWGGLAPPTSAPAAGFASGGVLLSVNNLTQGASGLSVSEAVEPSGHIDLAALGPENSIYFYWQISGNWMGPVQLGATGSAQSAPSLVVDPNGSVDVAVQGPSSTIYYYWETGGSWHGPLQAAAPGSAFSSPSLGVNASGTFSLAAKGPNNSLNYWTSTGGTWSGPTQVAGGGTTNFAPTVLVTSTSTVLIGAVADNHQAVVYSNTNGTWSAPVYSSPMLAYSTGTGGLLTWMGPGNSLVVSTPQTNTDTIITPGGSAYSSPSLTATTGSDYAVVAVGASDSLNYVWTGSGAVNGPIQIGGGNTSYSAPSILREPGGNLDVAIEGPNNTLSVYWESGGAWHGPTGIGAAGTTYTSAS